MCSSCTDYEIEMMQCVTCCDIVCFGCANLSISTLPTLAWNCAQCVGSQQLYDANRYRWISCGILHESFATCLSHVAHMSASCHTWMHHTTNRNASCQQSQTKSTLCVACTCRTTVYLLWHAAFIPVAGLIHTCGTLMPRVNVYIYIYTCIYTSFFENSTHLRRFGVSHNHDAQMPSSPCATLCLLSHFCNILLDMGLLSRWVGGNWYNMRKREYKRNASTPLVKQSAVLQEFHVVVSNSVLR